MPEPNKLNTAEIEYLLREAQATAGVETANPAPAAAGGDVGQIAAAPVASPPGEPQAPARQRPAGPPVAGKDLVGDDINYLLAQAEQAIASVDQPVDPAVSGI